MYWIHKHQVWQDYGGSEEGGWWYERGYPIMTVWQYVPFFSQELAYKVCRRLNNAEHERRANEEDYEYTSVLSDRSTFYAYSVSDSGERKPVDYPTVRPHYE